MIVPTSPAPPQQVPAAQPTTVSFGDVWPRLAPGVSLLVGAPLASPLALPFCAPFLLAEQTVMAVDGANCFDLYRLTEWARRKQVNPLALLRRLRVARAFTPFQLATILHHIGGEMERYGASRLIITGFPDCLFDEELSAAEARNTFESCRASLARLSRTSCTTLIFTNPPAHAFAGRDRFLDALADAARVVWQVNNTHRAEFVPVKAPGLLSPPSHATGETR